MNYKLNEDKMFADITDGIAIVINSETGIYYGMNSFGTNVYENIVSGVDTDKILKALKKIPNVPENIEKNFKMFVDAMVEKEVLLPADSNDAEPNIDASLAKDDDYALELKEYNDAQELLLADPIHEVKEETGWTPEKDSIGYTKEETKEREKKLEE
ncbi:MAG: PqqD family protein [Cyanobacteriota bacterium]|nr:PqqD family protein [Cyanobacteriota bacterium]